VETDTHTHRHTDTHTDTQTKYSNPRCACAPRVNNISTDGPLLRLPEPEGPLRLPEPEGPLELPEPERPLRLPEPEGPLRLPKPEGPLRLPEPEGPLRLPEPEGPLRLPKPDGLFIKLICRSSSSASDDVPYASLCSPIYCVIPYKFKGITFIAVYCAIKGIYYTGTVSRLAGLFLS